jgi:hypothetical protein
VTADTCLYLWNPTKIVGEFAVIRFLLILMKTHTGETMMSCGTSEISKETVIMTPFLIVFLQIRTLSPPGDIFWSEMGLKDQTLITPT